MHAFFAFARQIYRNFAKRTFGSLALHHCGPLKIIVIDTTIWVSFNHCDIFVATWGHVTPLTFAASCDVAADELFISNFYFFLAFWLKNTKICNEQLRDSVRRLNTIIAACDYYIF